MTNYPLINLRVARAANLQCDFNIDTYHHTIVSRIVISHLAILHQGLGHNRSNTVDGPRKSIRWTL